MGAFRGGKIQLNFLIFNRIRFLNLERLLAAPLADGGGDDDSDEG